MARRRCAWPAVHSTHARRQKRGPKPKCQDGQLRKADVVVESESRVPVTLAESRRRIAFIDFWPGFQDNTDRWFAVNWFVENLPNCLVVKPSEDPDVMMFSLFGRVHQKLLREGSRSKLVYYTGENVRPPVGKVPLCISFDHIPNVPATVHTRIPLWVFTKQVHDVIRMHRARARGEFDSSVARRDGFCSWVASNAYMYNAQVRMEFVMALSSQYKQVACGGEVMNNVGGCVKDKMSFLRKCKFNICFENALHPGYCTEKLLHAFAAGCVPIYWGDPAVSKTGGPLSDFNPAALISSHDFESPSHLIQHIKKVDGDPELLNSYLQQPILSESWYERLQDWPTFCQNFVGLLFADCEKGTPPLPVPLPTAARAAGNPDTDSDSSSS